MQCPGCKRNLPFNLERGYSKKHGIHHGSVCPYCRAHITTATPTWIMFAVVLAGWTVLFLVDYFLFLSELTQGLIGAAWLVAVVIWYARSPKVVIPKEECED